jgi:hypothetical protein
VLLKIYELSPWHAATAALRAPGVDLELSGVAATMEVALGGAGGGAPGGGGGGDQEGSPMVK